VFVVLLALAPAAGAAPSGERPTVRIWGATQLRLEGRSLADEAGARWVEVEGRLTSDRDDGLGGATVRFERDGATEQTTTEADGTFRARLRDSGGRTAWVARFDGGERWRPASALVPAARVRDTTSRAWVFFAPLYVLGAALAATLGVLGFRRLRSRLARWCHGLRRRGRGARGRASGPDGLGATGVAGPRWRVVDALRRRPLAGARWTAGPSEPGASSSAGADGLLCLTPGAGSGRLTAVGYLPRETGREPTAGEVSAPEEPSEELSLFRARDAIVALLEAAGPPAARPAGGPETVLRLAGRLLAPEDALRLAELCYGRARRLDDRDVRLLAELGERAVAAGGGVRAVREAGVDGIVGALADEPAAPAPAGAPG
jgi:hypothetical protein